MAKEPGLSDLTEMSGQWLLNVWEMLMFKRNGRDPFLKCRKWTYFRAKQITPCLGWAWMGSGWISILSSNQLLYTSNLRCNSEHLHPLFPDPSVQSAFRFQTHLFSSHSDDISTWFSPWPTCMGVSTRKPSTSTLAILSPVPLTSYYILIMNQSLTIVWCWYYGNDIN